MSQHKNNKIIKLAMNYYMFYSLVYILIGTCWIKYARWVSYDRVDITAHFYELYFGVWLILMAPYLKLKLNIRILSLMTFLFGLILEVKFISSHYASFCTINIIGMLMLISIVVSCWAAVSYFVGIDNNLNKMLSKKFLKYYAVIFLILYLFVAFVGKHYAQAINGIASSGSMFVSGGLDYNQIITLVKEKVFEANLILYLVSGVIISILFIIYKNILKGFMQA